ncbi:MAG: hypothetical protein OHK0052_15400 [Anaerolineales bacterium]
MRLGQNPAKFVQSVAQPAPVTVALITYIPFVGGYYADALRVLQVCLESIRANTEPPFDLLVFDNASCPEVRAYLSAQRDAGAIQYLILSDQNIGKGGAWNFIFGAAPGEYLAYADSDVYFYPGWLPALRRVLQTFPDVGMVTGMPLLNPEEYATSTLNWAQAHPQAVIERGNLLAWEDYWQHAGSLGNDEAKARAFYQSHQSTRITFEGQTCYAGAGHFQFLARSEVLRRALPIPSDKPMGQVRSLDVQINQMGFLRLSTPEWWVRHLGNTLPEGFSPLAGTYAGASVSPASRKRFAAWGPARRLLVWLHNKTFEALYR